MIIAVWIVPGRALWYVSKQDLSSTKSKISIE